MATEAETDLLRGLLGDRDEPQFFEESELDTLLTSSGGSLNKAAALGWSMKAAKWAALVDTKESGSERLLSQKYKNALSQAKLFSEAAGVEFTVTLAGARVVGRSMNLRECPNFLEILADPTVSKMQTGIVDYQP